MGPKKGDLTAKEEKLFELVSKGDTSAVKSLLNEDDVRVDCLDKSGMTPLQQAAYRGKSDLCQLLLLRGADVNSSYQDNGYTTLMFAALSGDLDTTRIVLENGARTYVTNSIGRTASQMAAFVGQHHCVSLINNFFSKEDLAYYTKPQGLETEPKLQPHKASSVYKVILNNNMKTVKIVLLIQEHPELLEDDKIYKLFEILCEKMMKQKNTNEVMALKFHYISCVLKHCFNNKDKLEEWIKTLLKGNAKNFEEGQEKFIRSTFSQFPYGQNQLIQQVVMQLHKVKIGDSPSALDVLDQAINGQRMPKETDQPCSTCSDLNAVKKCTKCKYAHYCNQKCQRLHWFTHKKWCKELKEMQIQIDEHKRREEEEEKRIAEANKQSSSTPSIVTTETAEEKQSKQSSSTPSNATTETAEEKQSKQTSSTEEKQSQSAAMSEQKSDEGQQKNVGQGDNAAEQQKPRASEAETEDPYDPTDDVPELLRRGNEFLQKKLHQKAIDNFQKAVELDSSCEEAQEGYKRAFMENLVDSDDIKRRAQNSDEIKKILAIPEMVEKLQEMRSDPEKLQEHLRNPDVAKNLEKLMECALQD